MPNLILLRQHNFHKKRYIFFVSRIIYLLLFKLYVAKYFGLVIFLFHLYLQVDKGNSSPGEARPLGVRRRRGGGLLRWWAKPTKPRSVASYRYNIVERSICENYLVEIQTSL